MLISLKKTLDLPVMTTQGVKLGLVRDIELDVDTSTVRAYMVGYRLFSKKRYRIAPSQIKTITKQAMIVEDTVIPLSENIFFQSNAEVQPMMMSSEKE